MGPRIGGFREAYRVAHAAGWDAGNRRMAAAGRAEWDSDDFAHAAATFQSVIRALGFDAPESQADPGPAPREGARVH